MAIAFTYCVQTRFHHITHVLTPHTGVGLCSGTHISAKLSGISLVKGLTEFFSIGDSGKLK